MIILNDKKFAVNDTEFTNSLFEVGGTCVGYYKKNRKSIYLMDHQKNRVGVINKELVLGTATIQEDGAYWYSYATPSLIGEYDTYSSQRQNVLNTYNNVFNIQTT